MTRAQAERRCKEYNAKRDVYKHGFWDSASAAAYWEKCTVDGNFLINGGNEYQRADMLVEKLAYIHQSSALPVILLTCSDVTEEVVVDAAMQNCFGRAKVSSSQHKNYHPFYGLEPEQLHSLFMNAAIKLGKGNTDDLSNYVRAFITIGSVYYSPTLASLEMLDKSYPKADKLEEAGKDAGVDPVHTDAIHNYPGGAAVVRDILKKLRSCYSNIGTKEADNPFSIVDGCENGLFMCINVNSPERELMNICLAEELKQLLGRGRRFHLIFDNVPLCNDELYAQLLVAKSTSGGAVGICDENVAARTANVSADNVTGSLLSNISQFVIFHTGEETDSDLTQMLSAMGVYTHSEVQVGGGHGWLDPTHHVNYTVVSVGERPRVRPEDMDGYGVLLSGHNRRTVHLYRKIKI